ncbi:MAG: oligosaccharide flippase family protein [Coriobacteriia bacterium]|nr:oligosaccharide flippase family protein [Coriobacteriia bacterium]
MGIARKSVIGFGGQVYMLVIGLASTILVARLLGAEGKGVLAIVAAIPSLGLGVASFGLGPALGFMAGKNHYSARDLVTAAVVWSLVLGAVVGAVVWLFRDALLGSILQGLTTLDLAVVVITLPTYYVFAFLGALFIGHGRAVAFAGVQSAFATLNLAAVVMASLLVPDSSTAVVVALSIASTLSAILSLAVYRARFSFSPRRIVEITKAATPYAAKAYAGQASTMFFLRADVFFLNYYAGPSAVGVYSVATNLAEKLWLLSSPVASAVFSSITGAERHDAVRLTTLTSRALLVLNALAGIALFGLAFLLVPTIYGAEFTDAIWYLGILLPGVVVYAVCQPYGQFFVGQLGRPGVTSILAVMMMVFSAVLYVTLIPVMGPAGAAWGSTLSYSSALLGYLWLMPRAADVTIRQMLVPTREDFGLYRSVAAKVVKRIGTSAPSGQE